MAERKTNAAPDSLWSQAADQALMSLGTSAGGLSGKEAAKRLKEFGANSLKPDTHASTRKLFFSQFKSPVTLLLIGAAILSMLLADVTDAVIILVIILISSLLGFWQEKGAAGAVRELLKMVQLRCALLRDGKEQQLPVENAVPGDIAILNAGDMIPADCLLLEADSLFVDEAAFTGETFPVEKTTGQVPGGAPLSQRTNALFMGAHVISGKARALVVNTGPAAEFGKIAESLRLQAPETDFEKGIRHFGYLLMQITLLLVIIIFGINVLLHKPALDSMLFSLALAVGLTPQLLPAIVSINLSTGARSMAKEKVIVKRLSSIENIGSMNVLCSDKTGTITEGKVKLKEALDSRGSASQKVMQLAWLNASLQEGFVNPIDDAIRTAAGTDLSNGYVLKAEVPYDFFRKRLTLQVQRGDESIAITKGAFNTVMAICSTVETPGENISPIAAEKAVLEAQYEAFSKTGLRVLGVAYKNTGASDNFTRDDEKEMTFLGFLTFFDPLKKDVSETIGELNQLGVKLKLITGDNALVAHSLAMQIGMTAPVVRTGNELRQMSNHALMQQAARTDVFAEVEPNQKERIILALKSAGFVTGFMGDGINDAPALHAADVGISVDSAVDVAKQAADIVLLNQSLEVLITGIRAGRKTFTNTMKYIFMATSANFGNMFSMAGASLLLPFLPLLPKQILITNLLTDLPEMAIATDSVTEEDTQTPHRWDLGFIKRFMIVFGLISSVFDYITFGVLLYVLHASQQLFQTGWLTESVISAALIVLVVRTRLPFFKNPPSKSLALATGLVVLLVLALPYLPFAGLLNLKPLSLSFYLAMLLIVVAYNLVAEWAKQIFYRHHAKKHKPM